MDRISALRNVEEALEEFEDGELSLAELERKVEAVVRTYATEFEAESLAAYRVRGTEGEAVVVAASPGEARERATELRGVGADGTDAEVERLSPPPSGE